LERGIRTAANVVDHIVAHRGNRMQKKLVGVRRKGLTPREQEVALLAKRKLTNGEIARTLGIKRGTVNVHVHNILKKKVS
jgi:DNA-binding CsgD family transcriptional regulator